MRINFNERGLEFEFGELKKVLLPGSYPFLSSIKVEKHSIHQKLISKKLQDDYLDHPLLSPLIDLYKLGDNNIAIVYEDGIFASLIGPGKHAFWKGTKKREVKIIDLNSPTIDPSIDRKIITKPEVLAHVTAFSIEAHEKGLLFIEKQFIEFLEPGNYFFWKGNKSINLVKADLRQQQIEISGQEIMTSDKIGLRLSFVCHYKIRDLRLALIETNEFEKQLYTRLQLILREYIGSLTLDDVLNKKEEINKFVMQQIKESEEKIGIEIAFAGVKDVILPGDIKEIINQVLIAEKKAQANVITRREETASTRSLMNTAKLMEENTVLLKLKELEYIEKISEKISQISVTGGGHILDQLRAMFTNISK